MQDPLVVFSHGMDSSPASRKIQHLSRIAEARAWPWLAPDYTFSNDPKLRIAFLLAALAGRTESLILVGSSMGAYVSLAASEQLRPLGLFLMAPAVWLPRYAMHNPTPHAQCCIAVHGWDDDVVPVDNAIAYCRHHRMPLALLPDGHRLENQLAALERLFGDFLQEIIFRHQRE